MNLYKIYNSVMKVFKELIKLNNSCIGLGFFDGIHIGHRELLTKLVKKSKIHNTKSVVLTFKSSPATMFTDEVKYINTLREREQLISSLGVDYIIALDFNKELMNTTPNNYLKNVVQYLSPQYIICGFNHTFGKNKQGNPSFLEENKILYKYEFESLPPVMYKEKNVSSTLIKQMLSEGDIKNANLLLDNTFKISGTVKKGNELGKTIDYPTANIDYPDEKIQVPFGVYKVDVTYNNKKFKGIMNYGQKPTVNYKQTSPVAEVHIIGFNKDIYGENIEISILDKIRDEQKFNSLDELKNQIQKDLSKC